MKRLEQHGTAGALIVAYFWRKNTVEEARHQRYMAGLDAELDAIRGRH